MALRAIYTFISLVACFLLGLAACSKNDGGDKKAAVVEATDTSTVIKAKSTSINTDDAVSDGDAGDGDDGNTPDPQASQTVTVTQTDTDQDADGGDPSDPDAGSADDDDEMAGGWLAGDGVEGCAAKGVAWIAVVNSGPGQCSTQKLVPWCCTEANIFAHFPSSADQLKMRFDGYRGDGLKLYHCSQEGDRTYFHFGKYANSTMTYKFVYVTGKAAMVPDMNPCPKVTSADLGIPANTGTSGGMTTNTNSATATVTSTSTSSM